MKNRIVCAVSLAAIMIALSASAADNRNDVDPKDRQSQVNRTETKKRQAKWYPPLRRIEKSRDESVAMVIRRAKLPWEPFAPGD